jgi:hypothetical protein
VDAARDRPHRAELHRALVAMLSGADQEHERASLLLGRALRVYQELRRDTPLAPAPQR